MKLLRSNSENLGCIFPGNTPPRAGAYACFLSLWEGPGGGFLKMWWKMGFVAGKVGCWG